MNIETVFIIFMSGIFIIAIPVLIWAYRKDKKRMAAIQEFQSNLKIGDKTDLGTVLRIEGDYVVTEKYTPLKYVWPPTKK